MHKYIFYNKGRKYLCKGSDIMKYDFFTKEWWIAAGIRALKTVCQTAIATIGTAMVMQDVNWIAVVSASALAGVLSLLTSVAGLPELSNTKTYNTSGQVVTMEDVNKELDEAIKENKEDV